jgi:hypothetical protein
MNIITFLVTYDTFWKYVLCILYLCFTVDLQVTKEPQIANFLLDNASKFDIAIFKY